MDSMDSLDTKMNSGSKTEGDAKTSAGNIATAAIRTKLSDRDVRIVKRRKAKKREYMRKYSKERYANQSAEQKKEASEKRKQKKRDKAKKNGADLKNKMTTDEMERRTKIPKMDYKTIPKNSVDPVVIAPKSVGTRKCDCASSGKTDYIEDCKNANRPIWTKSGEEFTICPVECTIANCCFRETN